MPRKNDNNADRIELERIDFKQLRRNINNAIHEQQIPVSLLKTKVWSTEHLQGEKPGEVEIAIDKLLLSDLDSRYGVSIKVVHAVAAALDIDIPYKKSQISR